MAEGWADGWMDGWMDFKNVCVDGREKGWINKLTYRWVDERMDACKDGLEDREMAGRSERINDELRTYVNRKGVGSCLDSSRK